MLRGVRTLYQRGVMLHSITHWHQHWRQGGQLYCAFCMSACKKQDPMNTIKDNPYFDKYSQKLKEKQREAPQEFRAKITEISDQRKQDEEAMAKAEQELKASQVKEKKLDNIMKLDLVKDKTAEEISILWAEYHKNKEVVYAIIPAIEYKEIIARTIEHPLFVYPLPRGDGYEFFLQRFSGNDIYFTPLIAYQQYKENAPSCLTISHYTELMDDKDIVLMVGEPDTNVLGVQESQLLALQVKMYYGVQSGLKFNLVRQMNTAPDSFNYLDLIKEFENYKKDVKHAKQLKSDKM